ncbi:sulfotransferase family protein [Caenorhabditis elegans]|uniref:Uncharacterized protein n=1 Tax=Caenorhabditis elegans TaxID=6239 RepID=O16902_CAEEL|nr:Uncharacterized protein CELE_C31B8.9 [Caenorhabditis elegans]CCD66299.2 Uncharacterized protein CELE_C31B8.9 [Caenorhabditis elegans]|eukprot:NP_503791.3 Uncharacterized protein CELE_C31B8.9 [Caenorhabditis elegans]
MVLGKNFLVIFCSCVLFLAQCAYFLSIFTRKPMGNVVEIPIANFTTELIPGDSITKFIPPFVPLLNDYVVAEGYSLHGCIVRKSMSQLNTNIMCYLNNTSLYEQQNHTLSDTWEDRKHPESRFVSFFVDKCINTNSCYDCKDVSCAVKMIYERLMYHVKNRHLIDKDDEPTWWFDWHAAPQTWNCDFYKYLTDYHLIKIGTTQKDRRFAMKQLQKALKLANVEDEYARKIADDTLKSDTRHGTHKSDWSKKILEQVRSDPYVRHYLHRIY